MYRSSARAGLLLLGLIAAPFALQAQGDSLRQSLETQEEAERAAAASQRRIDTLDDETRALLQRYRETLREAETLERYNARIETMVRSQQEEISSKRDQLTRIDETNRQIYPHLEDLLETLERFVALDVPFLPRERRQRLQSLQAMMDRADVTVSEKYRRLLEAYQIELEYGRTIGSYEGTLGDGEAGRSVTFLRVGRVALLYQTRDGREAGYWDRERAAFAKDNSYRDAVRRGLRVAEKRAAPELLRAPVYAPEVTP
ncbi:MAG: DUF3450 domain-containing protein [Algiphilus sp.]|nr:DUF3450 domain-containing protein [Algiphilus sp.]